MMDVHGRLSHVSLSNVRLVKNRAGTVRPAVSLDLAIPPHPALLVVMMDLHALKQIAAWSVMLANEAQVAYRHFSCFVDLDDLSTLGSFWGPSNQTKQSKKAAKGKKAKELNNKAW